MLLAACLSFVLHAALAIGALQMLLAACLSFVLHAALAIGASQVFVCVMFEFILQAALAIGALQMLCPMFEFCFARCFCRRGFAGVCFVTLLSLFCTLLLPSGLPGCLLSVIIFEFCLVCCSCYQGFADMCLNIFCVTFYLVCSSSFRVLFEFLFSMFYFSTDYVRYSFPLLGFSRGFLALYVLYAIVWNV